MNKKLLALTMLPMLTLSLLPAKTEAATVAPPACSNQMISQVDYKGIEATEHKWYCAYNSNFYTLRFFSKDRRLLGWRITKDLPGDKHIIISERDFTADEVNPPLCSYKQVRYFDYAGYHVKEHKWQCIYNNDYYVIKVYTQAGSNILLGWQIFKNWQIISSRSFI